MVGGTRYTYDLTNRLYAKKDIAREVLSVSLNQTYYTDEIASKYDPRYQSSFTVESQLKNSNFSPVAFQVRASPTDRIQGDFRSEWDPKASAITTISANGDVFERRLAERIGRMEPAAVHPGFPGVRRSEPRRPIHQRRRQHPAIPQPDRRQLHVQLRHPARSLPQSAVGRVLQCPVLRRRDRVPDLQSAGLVRPHRRAAGSPVQHLVHAGRNRHVLQSVRSVRRAAEPLTQAGRGESAPRGFRLQAEVQRRPRPSA